MEKIKHIITNSLESEKGKDILTVIIIILVGLGSFELGRLSKESDSGGIKIGYPSQDTQQVANVVSISPEIQNSNFNGKIFFASSKGSKYYTISCSAGKTIKQENRVYFTTGEEAQLAGYTLSSSCN
jgi:hypothetical protein